MPIDRRLRDAFDRAASTVDPDVELHLDETLRRASRRRAASVVGTALAASIATVALVVVIRLMGVPGGGIGGPSTSAQPSPSGSEPGSDVVGTYRVTLNDSDDGVVTSGLSPVGDWSMTLQSSGAMELVPPAGFEGSRASGHTFSLDGSTLRTDLYYNDYCSSIGTYAWALTANGLTLTVVDDECEIRRTILATRSWLRVP